MSTPGAASSAPAPADARKFSLNLSGLQQEMTPGDHVPGSARKPGSEDFLTTARAHNDEAITVRGAAKVRTVRLAEYGPKRLGAARVKAAWQPGGALLAIASEKDGALLLQIDEADLSDELGVASRLQRKRLLTAIRDLGSPGPVG